jgi:hypothetical protein
VVPAKELKRFAPGAAAGTDVLCVKNGFRQRRLSGPRHPAEAFGIQVGNNSFYRCCGTGAGLLPLADERFLGNLRFDD